MTTINGRNTLTDHSETNEHISLVVADAVAGGVACDDVAVGGVGLAWNSGWVPGFENTPNPSRPLGASASNDYAVDVGAVVDED